jgi:flagellar motility protein MotE (MotC chaperone)
MQRFDFKRASYLERRRECARLAQEIGDEQLHFKPELGELPELLNHGEQVVALSAGIMEGALWLITVTDQRILFIDNTMLTGLSQTSIDLDHVTTVSCEIGLIFGTIIIEDGASKRVIDNIWKLSAEKVAQKIRDAMLLKRSLSKLTRALEEAEKDPSKRLEKITALLQKGVIGFDEFQLLKSRLSG